MQRCPQCSNPVDGNDCKLCPWNWAGTRWITSGQACAVLGISPRQVRRYGPHGEQLLPGTYDFNGRLLLDKRDVEALDAYCPVGIPGPWKFKGDPDFDAEDFARFRENYRKSVIGTWVPD